MTRRKAIQPPPSAPQQTHQVHPRVGLALAGGGPLGAVYEVGALCALDDCLEGIAFTRLDHYVGVSAGGFIAAALANRMTPREICAAFIDGNSAEAFDPSWLMVPAYGEYLRRAAMLPGIAARMAWSLVRKRSALSAIEKLGAALPTGLFSNDEIDRQIARLFNKPGRSNDFRELHTRLTLVATCLDTAEAAPFGQPGWDHVPISKALQASAALPGLFPPVEIDGVHYVDGALKKTMHASVAMDEGIDLMLCLNPLVPYDTTTDTTADSTTDAAFADSAQAHPVVRAAGRRLPRVADGGLPSVLSQTFRSMIHSRMALGLKHYERAYPHTDLILIEPDHRDAELFLANTFSYGQRRRMAEHAYQATRTTLRRRHAEFSAKLGRHGISMREGVLHDPLRTLAQGSLTQQPQALGRAMTDLRGALDALERYTGLRGTKALQSSRFP
jgi:NTE family protein